MSETDVSLIRDEDVLRRMWQQTEDFSRKKEIRAHMYRLREERLRTLHAPDPVLTAKGVAPAMHVASFVDQSFQGLKSKEVRDAGSPPKEFRADLKELSNAGWNVESENRTTDDGHTQIRAVHADIQGRYDVPGGQGQFAAVDSHRQATTEYQDDTTSLQRREAASKTAAHEQVVRQTDDGALSSTTTSSTSSSSKVQQVSSTTHEVPYSTDYEQTREASNRNEFRQYTNTTDYEHSLRRSDVERGELISRKVDYPNDNTKIIVETRCLPDGTKVTSTRREFQAPVQSSRSEQLSSKSESKSYSSSSHKRSDVKESSKVTREHDIVDSQKEADDYDFKRNHVHHSKKSYNEEVSQKSEVERFDTRESSSKIIREGSENRNLNTHSIEKHDIKRNEHIDDMIRKDYSTSQNISQHHETNVNKINQRDVIVKHDRIVNEQNYATNKDNRVIREDQYDNKVDDITISHDIKNKQHDNKNIPNYTRENEEKKFHKKEITEETVEKKDQYQTTYNSDYTQKKISNDWSPTHQAWASTLRADTPSTNRASSPGSKTYQSSTTSLRSSVSPDKTCRKPSSRGNSPSKIDRYSPSRSVADKVSNTSSTQTVTESYRYTSPDRKPPASPSRTSSDRKRPSHDYPKTTSPTRPASGTPRPSPSPERKAGYRSGVSPEKYVPDRKSSSPDRKPFSQRLSSSPTADYNRTTSPTRPGNHQPTQSRASPEKFADPIADEYPKKVFPTRPSISPDRKPGYMRHTEASKTSGSPTKHTSSDRKSPVKHTPSLSPERKIYGKTTIEEDHYRFIDEETKMYTRTDRKDNNHTKRTSPSPDRFPGVRESSPSPGRSSEDYPDFCRPESPSLRPSLKGSRSPSPPKGPVTFTDDQIEPTKARSPPRYGTYDKKRSFEETEENTTTTSSEFNEIRDILSHSDRSGQKLVDSPSPIKQTVRDEVPVKSGISRQQSPSKYGTYDKKQRIETEEEISTTTNKIIKQDYDSVNRHENFSSRNLSEEPSSPTKSPRRDVPSVKPNTPRQPSPSKYGTYDRKQRTETQEITTVTDKDTKDYNFVTRREKASPRKVSEEPLSPTKKGTRESVSPVKISSKHKHTNDFITTERTTEETNRKILKEHPRQLITPSTSPTRKPKHDDTEPSTGQSSPTTSVSGFVYFSSPKTEKTIVTDLDDVEVNSESRITVETTEIKNRPESLDVRRSPSPSKIPCRSPSPEKRVFSSPTKENLPRKSSLKKPSTDNLLSPIEKPPSSFRVLPTEESDNIKHKIVKKDHPDKPIDSPLKTKHPFERRETYEERCLKILGVVGDTTKTTEKERKDSNRTSPSISPCHSPEPKEKTLLKSTNKDSRTVDVSDFINHEKEYTPNRPTQDRKSNIPSRESSPTKLQDIISQKILTTTSDSTSITNITKDQFSSIQSPDRDIGYQRQDERPKTHSNRTSPSRSASPEKKTSEEVHSPKIPDRTTNKQTDDNPRKRLPSRSSISPDTKPNYMKSTTSTTTKSEHLTTQDIKEKKISSNIKTIDRETDYQARDRSSPSYDYTEFIGPSKVKDQSPPRKSSSPERKHIDHKPSPSRESPEKKQSPTRPYTSPERKPGYTKPTSITVTKSGENQIIEVTSTVKTDETVSRHSSVKTSKIPESQKRKPTELKLSQCPSPTKKVTTKFIEDESIQSEREQEVLDKVERSLRKLSPNRDQRSPSREKSPGKTTISLQDIDVTVRESFKVDKVVTEQEKSSEATQVTRNTIKLKEEKPKDQKPVTKTTARNVSPIKKSTTITKKSPENKSPEYSPVMPRSLSPKKPTSQSERPQSPQVHRPSGIKPREPISSKRQSSSSITSTSTKTDKVTSETKKSVIATKQNSITNTSTTKTTTNKYLPLHRNEIDSKRAPASKGINKENVSPKKDDSKVFRTPSDNSLKGKKTSPQRMKSKPEIQVNDVAPTKSTKTSTNNTSTTITKKSTVKEPQAQLAPKPKSATALNTYTEEDDVIIDVEQAKSSRENSPDRICPTPVSFLEDVGTPRFPDEVSEPDDEFRKRTHHTIHETESIVDDIVEISEEEELFVKRSDVDRITESDECLLSVTDKVTKFTDKIQTVTKPKEAAGQFKEVEKIKHSDFIIDNLKSDECLLSVSEKVNKFAKGPRDSKDRSPSRNIVDEYDTQTTYQDDYTKLSVNDKAHLFIETAENVKAPKTKQAQKIERPDLSNVDESLKSDECLLSVSDKVNKFVKTAEQFLSETTETKDKEKKVQDEYEKFIKHITEDCKDVLVQETKNTTDIERIDVKNKEISDDKTPSFAKETTSSHTKIKDYPSSNLKPTERTPPVKITTLRSSEAVKKAKALFENIASSTTDTKTITKLTDIGIKKSPKTDSTIVLHPSADASPNSTDVDSEIDTPRTPTSTVRSATGSLPRPHKPGKFHETPSSPTRLSTQSPEVPRSKSPLHRHGEIATITTKTVLSRYPAMQNETPKFSRQEVTKQETPRDKLLKQDNHSEVETPQEKVPSYQRPTKTSQMKEEKTTEEIEVSSRRGSGKFGVELRRTSAERTTISTERRRSSTDHNQPCIEDIFDLDLLEQMLEKVVGYEQRRRIRAQIRVAKKRIESEHIDTNTYTKTKHTTITKTRSPDRRPLNKSPERQKSTPQKTLSPERLSKTTINKPAAMEHVQPKEQTKPLLNGHAKEPNNLAEKRLRTQSPEKPRSIPKSKSPVRQPSPEKKTRTSSPTKIITKPKSNRFSEYASAYMKKVGLPDTDKAKFAEKISKTEASDRKSKVIESEDRSVSKHIEEHRTVESKTTSSTKSYSDRTSSKDKIEIVQMNGKRSSSPEKKRVTQSPTERLYQRSPSPDFKRTKSDKKETIIKTTYETEPCRIVKKETLIKNVYEEPKIESTKKETIVKTVYDIEKKVPGKQTQEEKPAWVMNRNLKKISSDTRTFSGKKVESERPKYRAPSPVKTVIRPIDVITSSYGPGPLDADGRPLFGIKALRNGASNYQVKGTVVRSEYHSRNGSEPEGSVSVTAYSTQPEDLERLLQSQGERPSRIHGLAAITTTKKFGGDSGNTLREAHTKEDRAAIEHFTHSDRKVSSTVQLDSKFEERVPRVEEMREVKERSEERRVESREDKKTVRQSSVKSLTEKYIKNASETSKTERSAYPKAGLILRTATMKDSFSSDSSVHAGLGRTDSEHSLGSVEDHSRTTTTVTTGGRGTERLTTTVTSGTTSGTTSGRHTERSFLDSSTKVTGVQDILTRMKNADIVINEGDTSEDAEARALLNKFLGATVLMAGMQNYVTDKPTGKLVIKQETVRSSGGSTTVKSTKREDIDLDQCWNERVLRKLLEECTDYEQRRRIRARIRTLMAEQEACASAVTEALGAAGSENSTDDAREEEEVTVTSSVRRNSSEKTVSSSTTTKTSKVIESMTRPAPKPVSPFAKFRQLEKQNSVNSPNSPKTPQSPGSKTPYFKFTDPALQASALTIKERLLQWCRDKTRDYENVKLENFSTSWADGLAFCALVHHFLPDAFDYSQLTPERRRHNFTLAFKIADEKAGIYPLLDVDDMVAMRKPDWKCVFTYVQAIHRRFKDQP